MPRSNDHFHQTFTMIFTNELIYSGIDENTDPIKVLGVIGFKDIPPDGIYLVHFETFHDDQIIHTGSSVAQVVHRSLRGVIYDEGYSMGNWLYGKGFRLQFNLFHQGDFKYKITIKWSSLEETCKIDRFLKGIIDCAEQGLDIPGGSGCLDSWKALQGVKDVNVDSS